MSHKIFKLLERYKCIHTYGLLSTRDFISQTLFMAAIPLKYVESLCYVVECFQFVNRL